VEKALLDRKTRSFPRNCCSFSAVLKDVFLLALDPEVVVFCILEDEPRLYAKAMPKNISGCLK
jgi:hypothetical protein